MEFAIGDAEFGGNAVNEQNLQNIEKAAKLALKAGKEMHEFTPELSHKLHRIVQRGEIQEAGEELNELFSSCQREINERKSLSRKYKFRVAARFIHRYLDIHPYKDGNGRVARLLTSLLLIQLGAVSSLLRFDKPVNSRERYIEGLQQTPVTGPESEKLQILVDLIEEAAVAEDAK